MSDFRIEHDFLGDREVPSEAYYGIQTLRAVENFRISNIEIKHFPNLVKALAMVKKACARTNRILGLLDFDRARAIEQACKEIIEGQWHDQFIVDMIQGGAGTSTNMNANEVIANRALEILGRAKGDYEYIHPNNHVNKGQSTNDVYPTAIKLAMRLSYESLAQALRELRAEFAAKGEEFSDVIKMGRTEMQDAVPMTLGQEFKAFANTLEDELRPLKYAADSFLEMNLGATAIGSGITTDVRYAPEAVRQLAYVTRLPVYNSPDLFGATWDTGVYVSFSGVLRRIATKLSKIASDLRLLSSGPRAGFNEINLPAAQPGSSIMPGKVNPVIPEVVNEVAFEVIGNDLTVSFAAESGQLQLNAFEPIICFNILESIRLLTKVMRIFADSCVRGITANADHCYRQVSASLGIVTALVPKLGYQMASDIAREALDTGETIAEVLTRKEILTAAEIEEFLSLEQMTHPSPVK